MIDGPVGRCLVGATSIQCKQRSALQFRHAPCPLRRTNCGLHVNVVCLLKLIMGRHFVIDQGLAVADDDCFAALPLLPKLPRRAPNTITATLAGEMTAQSTIPPHTGVQTPPCHHEVVGVTALHPGSLTTTDNVGSGTTTLAFGHLPSPSRQLLAGADLPGLAFGSPRGRKASTSQPHPVEATSLRRSPSRSSLLGRIHEKLPHGSAASSLGHHTAPNTPFRSNEGNHRR